MTMTSQKLRADAAKFSDPENRALMNGWADELDQLEADLKKERAISQEYCDKALASKAREQAQAQQLRALEEEVGQLTTTLSRLEASIAEHEQMHQELKALNTQFGQQLKSEIAANGFRQAEIERLRVVMQAAYNELFNDDGKCPQINPYCRVCTALVALEEFCKQPEPTPDPDDLLELGGNDERRS